MKGSSNILAAALVVAAGLTSASPQQTDTPSRSHIITEQPPRQTSPLELRGLEQRAPEDTTTILIAPDATCGYQGGNSARFFTCGSTLSCVFVGVGANTIADCCNDYINCRPRTRCIDLAEAQSLNICDASGSCTGVESMISQTQFCIYPSLSICQSVTYMGVDATGFACAPSSTPIATMLTTFAGQSSRLYSTHLNFEPTSSTSSSSSSTTTITDEETNPPDPDKKSTPVGTIVGATIGGVAGIVILAVIAWFLFKRKPAATEPVQQQPVPAPIAQDPKMSPQQPISPGLQYQPGMEHPPSYIDPQTGQQYYYQTPSPGPVPVPAPVQQYNMAAYPAELGGPVVYEADSTQIAQSGVPLQQEHHHGAIQELQAQPWQNAPQSPQPGQNPSQHL